MERIKKWIDHIREATPDWFNLQNLLFVFVVIFFIVIVIWSESLFQSLGDGLQNDSALSGTATTLPGTPTPLPDELIRSASQTNGIILGAIIIILTVLAGTATILIRDRN